MMRSRKSFLDVNATEQAGEKILMGWANIPPDVLNEVKCVAPLPLPEPD